MRVSRFAEQKQEQELVTIHHSGELVFGQLISCDLLPCLHLEK